MSLEPQKFFIGVIDLFSILLPGAILTYLLSDEVGPLVLGEEDYASLEGTSGWLAFFVASYLAGHFIFLLGAAVLDEFEYDRLRESSHSGQIRRLARGEGFSWRLTRWLTRKIVRDADRSDATVRQAVAVKERYLDPLGASSAINAFQWSKARLAVEQPSALATVQRFEADSKFFRSLVVVLSLLFLLMLGILTTLVLISLATPLHVHLTIDLARTLGLLPFSLGGLILIGLLILPAFWRYVDQRLKSINQAYWYIITLEGSRVTPHAPLARPQYPHVTHAGGVVVRMREDALVYLLVLARSENLEWVLPKGHIEAGESPRETAVREVWEETGIWARWEQDLGQVSFQTKDQWVAAEFFLMRFLEDDRHTEPAGLSRQHGRGSEQRVIRWLPLAGALRAATHDTTRDLLLRAASQLGEVAPKRYRS